MRLSRCRQYILSQCYVMTKFTVDNRTDAKTSIWRGRKFLFLLFFMLVISQFLNILQHGKFEESGFGIFWNFWNFAVTAALIFFFTFLSSCSVLVSITTFVSSSFRKLEESCNSSRPVFWFTVLLSRSFYCFQWHGYCVIISSVVFFSQSQIPSGKVQPHSKIGIFLKEKKFKCSSFTYKLISNLFNQNFNESKTGVLICEWNYKIASNKLFLLVYSLKHMRFAWCIC